VIRYWDGESTKEKSTLE